MKEADGEGKVENRNLESSGESAEPKPENSDDECFDDYVGPAMRIPRIEELDEEKCEEISGYQPTRFELELLGQYWFAEGMGLQAESFFCRQVGGFELRLESYAAGRLSHILNLIGDEDRVRIEDAVNQEHRKRWGARAWEMFVNGDDSKIDELGW